MHVVITGVNRGIGRALAQGAMARGWQVTGSVRPGVAAPEGVAVIEADMRAPERLHTSFSGLSGVDVLINNAGVIGPERQATLDMDWAGFAETLQINTAAPLAVAQAVLPAMGKGGRILSVSSQMAYMGYAKSDRIAYRASKAALNKVMQGLATDLAPQGITVALVDPGWVRTDMGGDDAEEDAGSVAGGILDLAARLERSNTGRFFRFDGQERPF